MRHFRYLSCAAIAASLWTTHVHAQSTVYLPDVIELSGPGAVSGTNWRDGVALAIDEINKAGGILGRKIETEHLDTQSNPGVSRAQVQKVLDRDPYVVLGPIYSGSVKVNMALTQQAEVPQIVGAEAADITLQGNPWVFRTAFGQQISMPKIANYLHDSLKVKSVALVWVNNDFGKGGRDSFAKEMKARGIEVVVDLSTEQGQVDFGSDVIKLKSAKADAIFVYCNEEESARFLIEAKRQGITTPLFGETTLLSQKVVDLAGPAANGVRGHVGLSADAPIPAIEEFTKKFTPALQLPARPQRHQGLYRRLSGEIRHRKNRQVRSQGIWRRHEGPDADARECAGHADGGELGPERRHRPRQLPGRNHRRQAEDRGNAAEA